MPSNAGITGIIEFSQNEDNVYIGISNFVVGYELKTNTNILKNKIPINFNDRTIGKSTISKDGRFLICSSSSRMISAVLVELINKGRVKNLRSLMAMNYFFVKDFLIFNSLRGGFKKIDFGNIDKLMVTKRQSRKDDALFTSVNIPTESGKRGVQTIVGSTYYSFLMEDELGETVVNITKVLF